MILSGPSGIKSYISRSWSMSWPITVMMFFEFLIGLTDVYIAGRVSKEIQATYGFVIQIYFIFIVVANALAVGTVSVVSRLFTSGNREELTEVVFSSTVAAAIAGMILSTAGILLTPYVLKIVNIPSELKPFVIPFVRIYALGLLFHYVLINCNGILRSCDRVKKSLKTMTLVCALNIGFNFLFVFHTPLSYRGIAAATASSVFVGSILNLRHVRTLMNPLRRFSWAAVKKIADIGWPIGLAAGSLATRFDGSILDLKCSPGKQGRNPRCIDDRASHRVSHLSSGLCVQYGKCRRRWKSAR